MNQPSQPKLNVISWRLTNDELDEIDRRARAHNLTRSAYLSLMLARSPRHSIQIDSSKADLYKSCLLICQELRCQGNNINQIARGIYRANLEGVTFNGYLQALKQIRAANQDLATQLGKLEERL
jgi:hypothetical protein